MDNFFQNINKRLTDIGACTDLTESAVTERDQGKHNNATTGFKALAKKAGREYGSKAAGERVAGAQFQKMKRAGKLEEGHCSACNCSPCSCNEGNAFSGAVARAKANGVQPGEKIRVGGKQYPVREADPMDMEEGAFKKIDIDRQEQQRKKARHSPNKGALNQVPGVQNLKPHTKEHPLKNVARGIKAFVKGEPEPMDEVKKSKPDYPDIDKDGDRKESMKKAAADKKSSGQSTAGTVFDPEYRARMKKDKEGTGNFDKKSTSTGTVHTRRHREDDEDEIKSDEPKRKGRPKGPAKGPERVTAKAWKHKGDRKVKENEIGIMNRGEYDQEGAEAKGDMHTIMRHAHELETHLQDSENLPTWVIEKIGQIKGMMTSVSDYILSQQEHSAEHGTVGQGIVLVPEKAVSVSQRRAAGIARGAQKGKIPKSKLRGASKAMAKMPAGELHKFAATKEKGLPKHAETESADKPKKVKETTTSGSVSTAQNAAPKGSSKMSFGKGVYESAISESYKRKLSSVLSEGMTMTASMGSEGQRSINVSADGEDAEKLAELLKLAGLGGMDQGDMSHGCDSCGQAPCGCDTVDESYGDSTATENMPDWPTDPETTDANDPYLRRFSGGLNGAKSTGQTTAPVIASQVRRQANMAETVKLEQDLHRLYKNYRPK